MSEPSTHNLGRRTTSGLYWMMAQSLLGKGIQFLGQIVLAYYLAPDKFGLLGLAYTVTMFTNLVVNPGIDDVLARSPNRRQLSSAAFSLSLLWGCIGCVITLAAAAPAAAIYDEPQLFWMIAVLACGSPIGTLATVPWAELRATLNFRTMAMITLGEILMQQALMVILATSGFGAFSFVLPMPLVALLRTLLIWKAAPVKLLPGGIARRRWRVLWASSQLVFLSRLLQTTTSQGSYIALGIIGVAKTAIGQYFFALNLSTQVLFVVAQSVSTVLMPSMSLIQEDRQRMAAAVTRSARLLALVAVPLSALQALMADPVLRLVTKPEYHPSIYLLQILSLVPLLNAATWPLGALFTADGRFGTTLRLWSINSVLYFCLIIPASWKWGTVGTSYAVLAYGWISSMIGAAMAGRPFARWFSPIVWSGLPIIAAAIAAALTMLVIRGPFTQVAGSVTQALLIPSIFVPVFSISIWLMDPVLVKELFTRLLAPIRARLTDDVGRSAVPKSS